MAKVLIKNTTQGDITISALVAGVLVAETVPGAMPSTLVAGAMIDGSAQIDESLLEVAMSKPAVQAYFESGMLVPEQVAKAAKADKK